MLSGKHPLYQRDDILAEVLKDNSRSTYVKLKRFVFLRFINLKESSCIQS